jgi:hypothetical protein
LPIQMTLTGDRDPCSAISPRILRADIRRRVANKQRADDDDKNHQQRIHRASPFGLKPGRQRCSRRKVRSVLTGPSQFCKTRSIFGNSRPKKMAKSKRCGHVG